MDKKLKGHLSARVTPEIERKAKAYALKKGRSVSWTVNFILDLFFGGIKDDSYKKREDIDKLV